MRYALNVAPINGWETHSGIGRADQSMSAVGAGSSIMLEYGSATLQLSAQGSGLSAARGAGSAPMQFSVSGIAHAIIHGYGSVGADLAASGEGTIIPFMGGVAILQLSLSGNGNVAPANQGRADFRFSAIDVSISPIAARGAGLAEMALTGAYGIPYKAITDGFISNKRDRTLRVGADDRRFTMPADHELRRVRPERPLRLSRESRRF